MNDKIFPSEPSKAARKDNLPGTDETKIVERIKKPEDLLSGEWLQQMTDQELVLTVMSLVLELQSRVGKSAAGSGTNTLDVEPHPFSVDKAAIKRATEEFTRLPARSSKKRSDAEWRFILISANPAHKPLAIELHDEIVIGRAADEGAAPDLDLSEHDGAALGVSRRHALLRPSKSSLLLIDQDSTNGTFCNEKKLAADHPYVLADEDTLSFGKLHFKIMFVSQPG